MRIAIVGWYGTETIGDRAILAGLFSIFSKVYQTFSINLCSLNTIFTRRTIFEDMGFYKQCAQNANLQVEIYDSQNANDLKRAINTSDIVVIGGGPLMDLWEMKMLDFAFYYAKSHKKRTAILGCGWGPLKTSDAIDITKRLVKTADLTIFRDAKSKDLCEEYLPNGRNVYACIDPAFFACNVFLQNYKTKEIPTYAAVNFRDVQAEADHYAQGNFIANFSKIVRDVAKTGMPIKLVPMHNFPIGGDDRLFLNKIATEVDLPNVEVIRETQSLTETMRLYREASLCVGMRFHSIVLQTMLNGNNYIVDYTDPKNGKIINMLEQIEALDFYKKRYSSLFSDNFSLNVETNNIRFEVKRTLVSSYFDKYVDLIKEYL